MSFKSAFIIKNESLNKYEWSWCDKRLRYTPTRQQSYNSTNPEEYGHQH